ncbi:hypothetical protein [Limosilactobacillus sp.]|jgi:transcriptional regulator with XRE-family HTH domain|nr:hypothetical protein [Limosilactobacillus sp.]
MKFGEQIKERRQELDLTQAEVAESISLLDKQCLIGSMIKHILI